MKTKRKQFGLSLTEVLTSIVIVVLLASMSMPAINALVNSTSSTGSSEAMISAALSNARAIAMREQRYAGVRFQNAYNPDNNPLRAEQYMIFIIWEEPSKMNLAYGFRAAEGLKPIKLPPNIGVMDLTVVQRTDPGNNQVVCKDNPIDADDEINGLEEFTDTTTFSIIFSPQGNLVVHKVRVRNRNGEIDSNKNILNTSRDDVFNKKEQVDAEVSMFYQDDYFGASWSPYPNLGLGPENSRRQFYIYEQDKFRNAFNQEKPYSGYLIQLKLKPVYINSYTGTIISTD